MTDSKIVDVATNYDYLKITRNAEKAGFRDGITAGRESVFQNGFDAGYNDGFALGFDLGFCQGTVRHNVSPSNETDDLEKRITLGLKNCPLCKDSTLLKVTVKEASIIQERFHKDIKKLFPEKQMAK